MRSITQVVTGALAAASALAVAMPAHGQTSAIPASEAVFVDSFTDGRVADAGEDAGFWTRRGPDTVAESDGKLVMTASGMDYANLHLLSPVRDDLNFLSRPLTFSVIGLELTADGTVPAEFRNFRFTLAPVAATEYLTPDAIGVDVRGDGLVRLGYKLDTPGKDPASANVLEAKQFSGDVTGFDLTLRPDGYELVVKHKNAAGTETSETFSGAYTKVGPGLTPADWGTPAGGGAAGSAIILLAQRGPVEDASAATTVKIDELRVVTE